MNLRPDIIVEVKALHGKESRMRHLAILAPGTAEREWANEQVLLVANKRWNLLREAARDIGKEWEARLHHRQPAAYRAERVNVASRHWLDGEAAVLGPP